MGRGVAVAMAELGLEQLRLSFATVVSTGRWVGTIESPTTTSLAQARTAGQELLSLGTVLAATAVLSACSWLVEAQERLAAG